MFLACFFQVGPLEHRKVVIMGKQRGISKFWLSLECSECIETVFFSRYELWRCCFGIKKAQSFWPAIENILWSHFIPHYLLSISYTMTEQDDISSLWLKERGSTWVISYGCFDVIFPVTKAISVYSSEEFKSILLIILCFRRRHFTCCSLLLWFIVLCLTKWGA